MPYAILTFDRPDSAELRAQLRPDHLAYLIERSDLMLAGGALLEQIGDPFGGLIIVDTEDEAEAQRFAAGDPFNVGGLFKEVRVIRWRKSFLDKKTYF